MIDVLGLLSVLGVFISLVFLIVSFLRKKSKKAWIIRLIICFAVFIFCMYVPQYQNEGYTQSAKPREVGIDGTINGDCFDISIVDVKWTDKLETSLGPVTADDEGNGLLCIIFSAKNTTEDTRNVAGIGFNSYVDGEKVLPRVVVGSVDEAIVFVGAVSSGMEIIGHTVWELPDGWSEFQTSYIDAGTGIESQQYFVIDREDIK